MAYSAKGRTKDFPVFDCDSHIYEPPEVLGQVHSRAPSGVRQDAFLPRR